MHKPTPHQTKTKIKQANSYIPYVDRMVIVLTQIGMRAFNYGPPSFRMCKYIFNTLGTMFNQPALVTAVSQEPLMKLFELLSKVLLDGQVCSLSSLSPLLPFFSSPYFLFSLLLSNSLWKWRKKESNG
jgi:hypothetical protein